MNNKNDKKVPAESFRFKGSVTEKELERLFANKLVNGNVKPSTIFYMSEPIRNEIPIFGKFSSHFYVWRKKKMEQLERERTHGCDPPKGMSLYHMPQTLSY